MNLNPQHLRDIRTFHDVIEYLTDELDWPIGADDLEDVTFEWEPDELGIPADKVPRLQSLRQLRPLATNQPWGIFFLEFDGPRLPLTALRRLLDKLVTKKRVGSSGDRRTWTLADLLFIVTTSTGDAVELHFLAFFDQPGQPAEIRSIPWRPVQSPQQHLKRLANELLPHLTWPDDPNDPSAWRDAWREAFKLRHGEAIRSAALLAERMADTAIKLRQEITAALAAEKPNGPFNTLMGEVRDQLVGSVDAKSFADMCAQTLVYGVLTSRITDPVAFGASPTLAAVPLSNAFLAAFFDNVHTQASVLDLEGIGLEKLVADLRESKVEAILDQFGASNKGGDPVIHFYEEFLQRYDRKMRADAGAFYTPQAVVEFMTRTVDSILRDRFELELGAADPSTWGEVAERLGFTVPDGVDPDERFVSVIDPATGTGTFLVEWLRRAKAAFLAKGRASDWPDHARNVVLPSLHAFELMLGPYSIAHLKVALELHDEGVSDASPEIVLTDALDHESHRLALFTDDPVSVEGERAADLKTKPRYTVCIGNPPYDREQKDLGDKGKRKGGVARFGAPGVPALMKNVLDPLSAAGLGRHAKNAYNDYVYFWTWGIWQAITRRPGPGVVAFITAASYLDGVSLGGLRSHLRDVFDELWIVDLGGEGRGARVDENVFAIRTPVAIAFGIRTSTTHSGCDVRYLRVDGTRDEKLAALAKLDLLREPHESIGGSGLDRLTPASGGGYHEWPEVSDLLPLIFPGCKAGRTWVIAPDTKTLEARVSELLSRSSPQRPLLFKDSPTGRKATEPLGRTIMPGQWDKTPVARMKTPPPMSHYGYRSFDRQRVIADPRFLDRTSQGWSMSSNKQIFLTTLTSTKLGAGPAIVATPYVPDLDHVRGSYGAKNVMSLFRDRDAKQPNVTRGLLDVIGTATGSDISGEALASYIYGLTGTTAFSERFAVELGEAAGPVRIPLTTDPALFAAVAQLGQELLWLHTWGERLAEGRGRLPAPRARELAPVKGAYPAKYAWDAKTKELTVGSGRFGPVEREVYEFEVSGLKVLQSWLGNRMAGGKGKKSSPLDDIGPERWTFTPELLTLLAILERTVELTPKATELLDQVVSSDLIDPALLPTPTEAERKPPKD